MTSHVPSWIFTRFKALSLPTFEESIPNRCRSSAPLGIPENRKVWQIGKINHDEKVTVVDLNPERIAAWNGPLENLPIYELGLEDVVEEEVDIAISSSMDEQKEKRRDEEDGEGEGDGSTDTINEQNKQQSQEEVQEQGKERERKTSSSSS